MNALIKYILTPFVLAGAFVTAGVSGYILIGMLALMMNLNGAF